MIAAASAAAVLGLANALHCAGMCGPFAVLARGAMPWQAGRVVSYTALGTIVGGAGGIALGAAGQYAGTAATWASAVALVAAAAWLAGFGIQTRVGARFGRWLGKPLRAAAEAEGASKIVRQGLFGLANGLVPCGAVYAALGLAATAGSAAGGAVAMAAFGAATVPGLYLLGRGGGTVRKVGLPTRRLVAAVMLVAGLGVLFARAPQLDEPADEVPACHRHAE